MARKRDFDFYTEVIIVTIVSLVSASIWIEFVKGILLTHFNNNLIILLTAATLLTLFSILVLHYFFTEEDDKNIEVE